MCRVYHSFEVEWAEDAATKAILKLHHTGNPDRLTAYRRTIQLNDPGLLEDFEPLHRTVTGTDKRHWQHVFPTERGLLKTLRQWARKTEPGYIGSNVAERAAMNHDLLVYAPMSKQQTMALRKGQRITPRYVISPRGREYLSWLEAREITRHEMIDLQCAEAMQQYYDNRSLMAGR